MTPFFPRGYNLILTKMLKTLYSLPYTNLIYQVFLPTFFLNFKLCKLCEYIAFCLKKAHQTNFSVKVSRQESASVCQSLVGKKWSNLVQVTKIFAALPTGLTFLWPIDFTDNIVSKAATGGVLTKFTEK